MKGRALIDLLEHGLKCGQYGDLPTSIAKAHAKAGHFDMKAVLPEDGGDKDAEGSKVSDTDLAAGGEGAASGASATDVAETGAVAVGNDIHGGSDAPADTDTGAGVE